MNTSPDHSQNELAGYREWQLGDGMSTNTIDQRCKFASSRQRDWGTLDQPSHVVVGWLQQYSGWTYNTYRNHLRSLYAFLLEVGHVDHDPMTRIRRGPLPRLRPQPISADQLAAALVNADHRLRTWIALGALAGMRCHEIAKIRGEDVTDHCVTIHGKGGVVAMVPTHPDLWALAQHYPRRGYWFPSPQARREHLGVQIIANSIRAQFRAVGIETGSVHRLRHTYCTNLSRAGVRPRVVQELMRHASLETTMGYDAVDDDERNAAIRRLILPTTAA